MSNRIVTKLQDKANRLSKLLQKTFEPYLSVRLEIQSLAENTIVNGVTARVYTPIYRYAVQRKYKEFCFDVYTALPCSISESLLLQMLHSGDMSRREYKEHFRDFHYKKQKREEYARNERSRYVDYELDPLFVDRKTFT